MAFISTENLTAYGQILLGLIILVLLGCFIVQFLFPARRLIRNLSQAIKAIQSLKSSTANGQVISIDLINKLMTNQKLEHCWTEFSQTLHKQTTPDDMGQERVKCWRSTIPAEVFFNVETLVAVELKTEYFKHQPGILTGIGIIGTFLGLLRGLSTFSVSSDPETVRLSLDTLIQGVREAFFVSVCAIALAMLTTLAEKLIVTHCIKQVEELCQLIDSLFESGAGEEYLARLVNAGESNATQTAQLKDALVSDLKEMLAEMIHQQTEAIAGSFASSAHDSGNIIAQAISESLQEPLQKIAAAVNTTTDNNGEVVTRALNEVLVTFSQQMKEMFGGQMGDINQLLQQTTTAMQSTVARFDQLTNSLGDAGKNAADVMSERLSTALESMEARQVALNYTMTEFVTQLREMTHTSQSETSSQFQQSLALLGEQVAAMTQQLQTQAQAAANTHQHQQDTLQQNASALAQELAIQVQTSMLAMQQQLVSMLDVMKAQSDQTVNLNTEQQKSLTQHTQQTVEALTNRLETSLATIDEQAKIAQSTMQQQLQLMVDALKTNAERTVSAQDEQQNRFLQNVAMTTERLQIQAQVAADSHQHQQDTLQQNASALAQELAIQVQTSMLAMQQQLVSMLDVMKAQSDQTVNLNTEQQKSLTQHTQQTVEALTNKLETSLATIDEQAKTSQAVVQEQLQVMVDALKQNAMQATTEQNSQQRRLFENMETALVSLNEKVEKTVSTLNKTVTDFGMLMSQQAQQSSDSNQATQRQLAEQSTRLIEQLTQQVQAMTAQTNNAVASMQTAVTSMRDVTKDNSQRMESSAGTLSLAADNFAKAGNSVAGVIQQSGIVSDKMATTAIALNTAADTVENAIQNYQHAGQAMSLMVEELKAIVAIAKQEVSVSQALVNQIKQSAELLQQAQVSVDDIFKAVCDELANAHEEFANNVVKGLKSSNTAYQKELKDAVDYLKTAIEELGEVAEKIPTRS